MVRLWRWQHFLGHLCVIGKKSALAQNQYKRRYNSQNWKHSSKVYRSNTACPKYELLVGASYSGSEEGFTSFNQSIDNCEMIFPPISNLSNVNTQNSFHFRMENGMWKKWSGNGLELILNTQPTHVKTRNDKKTEKNWALLSLQSFNNCLFLMQKTLKKDLYTSRNENFSGFQNIFHLD